MMTEVPMVTITPWQAGGFSVCVWYSAGSYPAPKAKYTHSVGGQTALFHSPIHSVSLFIFCLSVGVAIFGKSRRGSREREREPRWDWYPGRPQVCQLSKTRPMQMLCLACQSGPAPWSACLIYFTGKLKKQFYCFITALWWLYDELQS